MSVPISRSVVESLVREVVQERLAQAAILPPKLFVNASSRHMHITRKHLEVLFGPGAELSVHKELYQEGFYASGQTVTLVGPRGRTIPSLRILGPLRDYTQIELAFSDAIMLGIDKVPIRLAGDLAGSPGAVLIGPKGTLELEQGVVRSAPHVHMSPADAAFYGVKNMDRMKLRVGGELGCVFEGVVARVGPASRLEVHLDTDEANACGLAMAQHVELFT
jgi:putative phosphotransacetylase